MEPLDEGFDCLPGWLGGVAIEGPVGDHCGSAAPFPGEDSAGYRARLQSPATLEELPQQRAALLSQDAVDEGAAVI
ncbi:MAG TPA: hypothetical protein VIB78_10330, partial [Acidimicrobiia bacterium]